MRRYHKLLAGASWMERVRRPRAPDDWAFLQELLAVPQRSTPRSRYPPFLVHHVDARRPRAPGPRAQAGAQAARHGQGATTYYYENIEGGHGGAADNKQRAFMSVLSYEFLEQVLTGRGISAGGDIE